uniref:Uncharacterized protein n=1 Tax=Arundo donax TaxID=35708 RepID=A0A0A8ZM18_ARUDO
MVFNSYLFFVDLSLLLLPDLSVLLEY